MDSKSTGIAMVSLAVLILSATQLIIKSRFGAHGAIPAGPVELFRYCIEVIKDWRLMFGFVAMVLAALCWYAGLSRLPLSIAYPFAALSYPLIFLGAVFVLGEPFKFTVLFGNLIIVAGVLIVAVK